MNNFFGYTFSETDYAAASSSFMQTAVKDLLVVKNRLNTYLENIYSTPSPAVAREVSLIKKSDYREVIEDLHSTINIYLANLSLTHADASESTAFPEDMKEMKEVKIAAIITTALTSLHGYVETLLIPCALIEQILTKSEMENIIVIGAISQIFARKISKRNIDKGTSTKLKVFCLEKEKAHFLGLLALGKSFTIENSFGHPDDTEKDPVLHDLRDAEDEDKNDPLKNGPEISPN